MFAKFTPPKERFWKEEQQMQCGLTKQLYVSLPNDDFGRVNKRRNTDFRGTFQGREYSIRATNHWKVLQKAGFHLLFLLPKSSFGEHEVVTKDSSIPGKPTHLIACYYLLLQSLCSPNEDFGRPNEPSRMRFEQCNMQLQKVRCLFSKRAWFSHCNSCQTSIPFRTFRQCCDSDALVMIVTNTM